MRSSTVECIKDLFDTAHSKRINAGEDQLVRYGEILAALCSKFLILLKY